jgi:hypothetical protein
MIRIMSVVGTMALSWMLQAAPASFAQRADSSDLVHEAAQQIQIGTEDGAVAALGRVLPCDTNLLRETVRALQFKSESDAVALLTRSLACRPIKVAIPWQLVREAVQRLQNGSEDGGITALKRLLVGPYHFYELTCRALGYYEIKVSPDGVSTPSVDQTGQEPIHITLLPPAKDEHAVPDNYYLVVVSAGPQSLLTSDTNSEPNARVRRHPRSAGSSALFDVEARYGNQVDHGQVTLVIKPADHDWAFSAYSGSLTTDTEARHLNIQVPKIDGHTMQWKPESTVFLETGPCERGR